ncbi:hypothetical protein T08_3750, partial [Trichinella sp. T8]
LLINKLITKKCRSLFISSSEWSRHYVINFNQDHLRCSPFPHMHNKMSTKLETLNLTEALLSFHDESKEFQDDFRLECKEIEILVNKVNHFSILLKFGSKRRIDAGEFERRSEELKLWRNLSDAKNSIREVMGILRMREEKEEIQTYCKFRNCPRHSLRCSLKANVFLKNSLRRSHQVNVFLKIAEGVAQG